MNKNERDFIELVKRAIRKEYKDDGYFDETDWDEIYEFSISNGFVAFLYDTVKGQKSLPEEKRVTWDRNKFAIYVRETRNLYSLNKVLEQVTQAGIDYALFKGPIIADCYPNFSYRNSSDSDVFVDESDKQAASDIIFGLGYEKIDQKSNSQVTYFRNAEVGHAIELHTCLFEHYEGEKISILKGLELESPDKRIDYEVNGYTFRTLGVNEHLVFQFFHLIKHFVLEGASVRFFSDITLFVNKNLENINPDYFWECMGKLNYVDFCENFLTICIDYFSMDASIMNGHKCKASQEVLEALIVDYIYKGDKDKKRKKDWQLLGTMRPYLVGQNTAIKKSKFERILHYIFIKPSELNKSYSYAKKMPILLPIAWIHRALKRIFLPIFYRKNITYTGMEKVDLVEDKLNLLASVGIIDKE